MRRNNLLKAFSVLFILFLIPFSASGDWKITQNVEHFDAKGESLAKMDIVTYILESGSRKDIGKSLTILFDAGSGNMTFIYHESKEYAVVDFERVKPMMKNSIGMIGKIKTDVVNTKIEKKIKNWNTTLWKIKIEAEALVIETDEYYTREILLPVSYRKFLSEYSKLQSALKDMMGKLAAIGGFPVKSESIITVLGEKRKSTAEVTKVSDEKISESVLKVPSEYKKIEFNIMSLSKRMY